ncbi:potassium channel family protein [Niallia sp. 01092]|uniref:potassium channel family protein n=1 Tax=unclassified Niallia TaxID=2837522 RepID=UPI003FD576E4
MPNNVLTAFLRLPMTLRILFIVVLIITTFGIAITFIEPTKFPTFFDGIWWAIITISTVGYGDSVPETFLGKITGILLIFVGVGFISTYFVTLATAAVSKQNAFMEGKSTYKGKKHVVIVGWNERSKALIYSLLQEQIKSSITLIDESLQTNPLPEAIHFIQGNPNLDSTLLMANITVADKVMITSDQSKDELHADMSSILTLLAIKGLNPSTLCIVEILKAEQVSNARRAGADEIIQSNRLTSLVMHSSLQVQNTLTTFIDLLYQVQNKKLEIIPLNKWGIFEDMDFVTLSAQLLKEGHLLLGIKRGETSFINPDASFLIETNDQLIVIT